MVAAGTAKPFIFICGSDDFLVNREGKARFDELAKEVTDEFSREVLSGLAGNVGEVEDAITRFRESVQTVSMFGDKRLIWLKDVNFLADNQTGRAEGTLKQVEDLQELLSKINPAEVAVMITASPVDKRRSFLKWCEKNADYTFRGGDAEGAADALTGIVMAEATTLGVNYTDGALQLLLSKVGANTRLLIEETHKLATYLGDSEKVIDESMVAEMTPNIAEGDFFETAEAFFSGNLKWTLEALHRHFFGGGDARPVISALQNRNRLLLQIRALLDAGEIRIGSRGIEKAGFDNAASPNGYGKHFVGATDKSSFNVFTQNPWYLGKLANSGRLPSLRRLIDNQQEFVNAFDELTSRSDEQEEVLREMSVRCLGSGA